MNIEPKYKIGDVVYRANTTKEKKQHKCPDCLGAKEWKVTSPGGAEYTFDCPRCNTHYQNNHEVSIDYWTHTPYVTRLTIGSVQTDTAAELPVRYMAVETGVGSGSIYYEKDLHETRWAADEVAEGLAISRNEEPGSQPLKQYESSLSISDYQLHNAIMKAANDKRISNSVDIQMLFDRLRDCLTLSDVEEVMENFTWST